MVVDGNQAEQRHECVCVYLPERSVCGCHTSPELGRSGRDREDGGENRQRRIFPTSHDFIQVGSQTTLHNDGDKHDTQLAKLQDFTPTMM